MEQPEEPRILPDGHLTPKSNTPSQDAPSGDAEWSRSSLQLSLVLLVMLGLSLAGNVLLGWKVKSLGSETALLRSRLAPSVGMKVADLNLIDISGHSIRLYPDPNQPTILYIFRPGCKWCESNLASIRSLNDQAKTKIRIIGVSTTSLDLDQYLRSFPLPFQVFIASPSELTKVHFVGTPQTIELSSDGTVEQNWVGAYGEGTAPLIEKELSVKLPALAIEGPGN
jgi:peroxiredoxin